MKVKLDYWKSKLDEVKDDSDDNDWEYESTSEEEE